MWCFQLTSVHYCIIGTWSVIDSISIKMLLGKVSDADHIEVKPGNLWICSHKEFWECNSEEEGYIISQISLSGVTEKHVKTHVFLRHYLEHSWALQHWSPCPGRKWGEKTINYNIPYYKNHFMGGYAKSMKSQVTFKCGVCFKIESIPGLYKQQFKSLRLQLHLPYKAGLKLLCSVY